jgi:acetolactate synthase-1/2/3 large subunit
MDRSPVVVITGQADSRRQHKESHQAMDVVGMFRPITKWAHQIINPNNIPEVVRKAFKIATLEKMGACHIELPEDIAEMEATTQPIPPRHPRRSVPNDMVVDRAYSMIRNAKRPVVLAGNGTIRERANKQLRLFAESTGISVISTFMGKGCVDRDAPYCLFTIGLQAKDLNLYAVESSDLVITVGYDMVEYHPKLWNPNGDKRVIHIDFLPAEVDAYYRVELELVGDLARTLGLLNERVMDHPVEFDVEQHSTIREELLADFAKHKDDDTDGLIRPQKVLWDVRETMGEDDILISDVGAHKLWVARYYHCDNPNTCLISNGFCSMGFALPGAIAAKLVRPGRNVLAVCGDGGFLMNVQELETARRIGVNPVFMVWEDRDFGLISWKQKNIYGRSADLTFGNPDFVKLAEAFDCRGVRVSRSRDLAPALMDAFEADRPTVMVIPIDYRENTLLTERLGRIVCPI